MRHNCNFLDALTLNYLSFPLACLLSSFLNIFPFLIFRFFRFFFFAFDLLEISLSDVCTIFILKESLPASYKLLLYRKRFIKVPGKFDENLVGKHSWEDNVSHYSEDRDAYWPQDTTYKSVNWSWNRPGLRNYYKFKIMSCSLSRFPSQIPDIFSFIHVISYMESDLEFRFVSHIAL